MRTFLHLTRLILPFLLFNPAIAQVVYSFKPDRVEQVHASKDVFVKLTGIETFDFCLKSAIEKNWKFMGYKFIMPSERAALNTKDYYGLIEVIIGDAGNPDNITFSGCKNDKCDLFIDYHLGKESIRKGNEGKIAEDICPELPLVIKFFSKEMTYVNELKLKYYNQQYVFKKVRQEKAQKIKSKTLLIDTSYFDSYYPLSEFILQKDYPYKYELTGGDFLSQLKPEDYHKYNILLFTCTKKLSKLTPLQEAIVDQSRFYVIDPQTGDVLEYLDNVSSMVVGNKTFQFYFQVLTKQIQQFAP